MGWFLLFLEWIKEKYEYIVEDELRAKKEIKFAEEYYKNKPPAKIRIKLDEVVFWVIWVLFVLGAVYTFISLFLGVRSLI